MNTKAIKYLLGFVLALWASALSAQTHWSCDINAYQYDMTVYFELQENGVAIPAEDLSNYELAAFVGDQCRGIGEFKTAQVNDQTVPYGYLRVRSNVSSDETVSFKVYNKSADRETAIVAEANIPFVANQTIGMPSSPKALNIAAFTLTLSADETKGTVTGDGPYYAGAVASAKATPLKGYSFSKWSDESTDNPRDIVMNQNVTLTAVFAPIVYTIGYDLSSGTLGDGVSNPAEYNIESADITLNNPSRPGYTFEGWSGTDITDGETEVVIAKGSTGNRTYSALWSVTDYTISCDLAGGAVETPNPESYTVKSSAITLNNPTREGYIFAGWTGTDLSEATMAVTIAAGSMGDRSYTATWTPIEYTIEYNLDGGEMPAGITNPTIYTIESTSFTLNNPKKEGLSFAGWTGTDLDEATKSVRIAKGSTGNRSYTATWTDKPDVLMGDVNGDGKINSVDLSLLINKILGKEDPRFIDAAGDLSQDGKYNSVDLSMLINLILNQ